MSIGDACSSGPTSPAVPRERPEGIPSLDSLTRNVERALAKVAEIEAIPELGSEVVKCLRIIRIELETMHQVFRDRHEEMTARFRQPTPEE